MVCARQRRFDGTRIHGGKTKDELGRDRSNRESLPERLLQEFDIIRQRVVHGEYADFTAAALLAIATVVLTRDTVNGKF